jgi:LacI family transcriptional regulator
LLPHLETSPRLQSLPDDIDGIVARTSPSLAALATRQGIPLVNVWTSGPPQPHPTLHPALGPTGRLAAQHLMDRRFNHFGFIGHPRYRWSIRLESVFRSLLKDTAHSYRRVLVPYHPREEAKWDRTMKLLDEWIDQLTPPVGIFVPHQWTCLFFMNLCHRRGLRIPDDVGLITLDESDHYAPLFDVPITTVDEGFRRMGRVAVDLLTELMAGKTLPHDHYVSPTGLTPRRSTDVFAVDDRSIADALRYIWDHIAEKIGADDVAERLGLERHQLEYRFRKAVGRSPSQEIYRARLMRARQFLSESDDSIGDVAQASGFRDARHLFVSLRKETGLSPREYRNRHRR